MKRQPEGRFSIAICAASLLLSLSLPSSAADQTDRVRPTFIEAACSLPDLTPELRPRLRCGTVSVPRDYGNPGGGRFALAVIVVKSITQPSRPDPVVYISGGPGSPLTIYAAHQARSPYAPDRDLILVDQRGTGRSEPRLCPDHEAGLLETTVAVAGNASPEAQAARRAAYTACHDEAVMRGLDLGKFGTRVTVEDYEHVRQALGIDRWNVYGESYGTAVAMTLETLHPEALRSVVLDSLYPPDPIPLWSVLTGRARAAFFANCAEDRACASAYAELDGTYRETLDRLTRSPVMVAAPPQLGSASVRIWLTASLFEALVSNLIYYPPNYPTLPRLIAAVHHGDGQEAGTALASVLSILGAGSSALHAAVECRDRPHYREALPADASAMDRMQLYGICGTWSDLGLPPLVPSGTKTPTLVLAGQFDPVSGPALSRHVAEEIGPNARWVEIARVGHNVRAFSPCGAGIASAFIDRPTEPPDASCADKTPPIRFVTP